MFDPNYGAQQPPAVQQQMPSIAPVAKPFSPHLCLGLFVLLIGLTFTSLHTTWYTVSTVTETENTGVSESETVTTTDFSLKGMSMSTEATTTYDDPDTDDQHNIAGGTVSDDLSVWGAQSKTVESKQPFVWMVSAQLLLLVMLAGFVVMRAFGVQTPAQAITIPFTCLFALMALTLIGFPLLFEERSDNEIEADLEDADPDCDKEDDGGVPSSMRPSRERIARAAAPSRLPSTQAWAMCS
ncbi:MAG TPA: hypothetical protein EYQ80_01795 [Candidatus Poseidoniales archaeon]|nr:hypothetical protein [Candidatus Poseidoniales archaeon]